MSSDRTNGVKNGFSHGILNGTRNGNVSMNRDKRSVFLKNIFQIILEDGVEKGTDVSSKVVEFLHPEALADLLDLSIPENTTPDDELLQLCRDTIRYSVKTGHRRFFNQLYSGLDPYGLAGSWLTDTVNTSQYTYEVAPVFTLMENVVLKHMAELVGYELYDGIFCPGGSISNLYGLNLARYKRFPEVKEEGMHSLPKICLFTSKQAHYSIRKSAATLGIGLKYTIQVDCDEMGRMDPDALERAIVAAKEQGLTPFFVNATAGTTVSGAYDPLDAIADICHRHDLWMHVDCCWGGGALLSRRYKHLLKGVERSDSMSWNPHKMMGAPLQCCAFLTKHDAIMKNCHCANAAYLFQQDKFYDVSYDTGDKAIQCGRKVDVFKVWLMWKAKGDLGFEQCMDNIFDNARYLAEQLKNTAGFRMVFPEPQCTNVCFWYIPICLRDKEETPEWWEKLAKVAPLIKEKMVLKGSLLVGYQPLGQHVNFFRMVISNFETTKEDMDFAIAEIDRLGRDIVV